MELNDTSLTSFYDDLKSKVNNDELDTQTKPALPAGRPTMKPMHAWHQKIIHNRDILTDKCCKHLLLDIYCKILPLDKEYIDGHQGQMQSDIDSMLANKGMTPTEYLRSCYESTQAPLLEYMLRSADIIGRTYLEEKEAEAKDDQENDIEPPEPIEPDTDDKEIDSQLVDVTSDTEYETFVDQLKKKTIDKIVADVSEIIENEKEKSDMVFDTHSESAIGVCMDYMNKKLWQESTPTPEQQEAMIAMAIREATLRQFDVVFNQHDGIFREFASRISFGRGIVINESACNNILS